MSSEALPHPDSNGLEIVDFRSLLECVRKRFRDAVREQRTLTGYRTFTVGRDPRSEETRYLARFNLLDNDRTHRLLGADALGLAVPVGNLSVSAPPILRGGNNDFFLVNDEEHEAAVIDELSAPSLVFGEYPLIPDLPHKIAQYAVTPITKIVNS